VRYGGRIEIISYVKDEAHTVIVTPRRAIQLAHELIRYALRQTAP